ncbi:MAG: tetratricopeptide repeat protein [Deltaproteobacteria bacterium]
MLTEFSNTTVDTRRNLRTFVVCAVLIVVTLAIYLPAVNHEFISFDDPSYVTKNSHVSSGITVNTVKWAITSIDEANWHPITWLSHMTDVELYGMNPRGHHLNSIIIHTISAVLLLLLLYRLTGSLWHSSFVATLFALHPLHVESVAWVAERKDLLSAFFWFLTLLLYSEYVKKPREVISGNSSLIPHPSSVLYILALVSFVLGLMSKPMLVTLPIVLLLMDFWPLDRYRHDEKEQAPPRRTDRVLALIKEKIPFFACSLFSGIITIYAQHKGGATRTLDEIPFILRAENALIAYIKYIFKTIWPHDLAVLYPMPSAFPLWQVIGSLLVLIIVSVFAMMVGRRFPYIPVGWFWFLITLIPVIGLLQVGVQSMADRYSYIPSIGLYIMAAWGTSDLTRGLQQQKNILALTAGVVILVSAALTWRQLGYWRESISLYRHTLQVTTGNYLINNNLGLDLAEKGDLDAAIKAYQESLRIKPDYSKAHYNLGVALAEKGDLDAAIKEFRAAILIEPNYMKAHSNLGLALGKKGDLDSAIREYKTALQITPDDKITHYLLGCTFEMKEDLDAAIREYQATLRISPNDTNARNNLGRALARKN